MFRRFMACVASAALVIGTMPAPVAAQPAPAPVAAPDQTQQGDQFSTAQLESLLAPIALYPDTLLTQLLMATTNPLEIVAASRWLAQGSNRDLKGKALEDALRTQPWDPAVKSLIPFPQVLEMLNQQLEWTQQLGYAMQNQEAEVFDAIQRLRARAQTTGSLQSTPQQIVRTEAAPPPPPGATDPRTQNIVIEPADPNLIYVPSYDPSQVYGAWPYADIPPVYYAPLPGYGYPGALVTGLVFGVGVAIAAAALWGWARPNWGCCWGGRYGGVNVNVNRWNAISPNRPWRGGGGGIWHGNNPGLRPGGGMGRPGGPVGRPVRPGGPPGIVTPPRPGFPPGGGHPPGGQRPGGHQPGGPGTPGLLPGPGHRPGIPGGPGQRPGLTPGPGGRPGFAPGPGGRPGFTPGPGGRPGYPGAPGGNRPAPGPGIRPVVPQPTRPEIVRPQPRPSVRPGPISRPTPAPIARPAPAPRPAIARPAPRPAPQGRPGGGGGGGHGGGRHR